jgi:hypothetical protein
LKNRRSGDDRQEPHHVIYGPKDDGTTRRAFAGRRFWSGFENSSAIDSQPPQAQASHFLRSE